MVDSNWSIAEIKSLLNKDQLNDEMIDLLTRDKRKGVQQAVRAYKRRKEQEQHLQMQLNTMQTYENKYYQQGKQLIAGVDEVGRGPLAGPVVAAAVILPKNCSLLGITDSKKLSAKKRELFAEQIKSEAIAYGIGIIDHEQIDQLNIYQASILAMSQAIQALTPKPDQLLVDAVSLNQLNCPSESIIKGDQKSISIAAASIIAKVTRDQMMLEYHDKYPDYQFATNQGYGTAAHLHALKTYGVSPIHRRTFAPVKDLSRGG
ncbi:ribonuclease HII [Amphibacillus sediminis]|uniref:ribonuclease HII n=1 Tax=Amphibacillus sediminis TaxID=360185 RepID=UPI00082F83F0|nr:ribonuclease HII [Amphibacillus sediminis]